MHSFKMIFQVVPPSKFFSKARTVGVETSPVKSRYLMNGFFMPFAVVWSSKTLSSSAVFKSAAVHLLVFLLMFPENPVWMTSALLCVSGLFGLEHSLSYTYVNCSVVGNFCVQ